MSEAPRISRKFRAALGAKGALLGAFAAGFAAMALDLALQPGHAWWIRIPLVVVFGYLAWFLGAAAGLALADAATGLAVRSAGAEPLASRRAGWSIRTSDGRFVEYILWNPWGALEQGRRYTVTFGRRSRVLVAPPELEA